MTTVVRSFYVYEVAREVATAVERFAVVIAKSTVPVGTCDEIQRVRCRCWNKLGKPIVRGRKPTSPSPLGPACAVPPFSRAMFLVSVTYRQPPQLSLI